jgi:hypothetical protein
MQQSCCSVWSAQDSKLQTWISSNVATPAFAWHGDYMQHDTLHSPCLVRFGVVGYTTSDPGAQPQNVVRKPKALCAAMGAQGWHLVKQGGVGPSSGSCCHMGAVSQACGWCSVCRCALYREKISTFTSLHLFLRSNRVANRSQHTDKCRSPLRQATVTHCIFSCGRSKYNLETTDTRLLRALSEQPCRINGDSKSHDRAPRAAPAG